MTLTLGLIAAACGSDPSDALGVLKAPGQRDAGKTDRDTRDAGASRDAGADAGGDRSGFGFDHLAAGESPLATTEPEARMTPASVPEGWMCAPGFGLDAVCDCGCGVPDGACAPTACVGPGCSAPGCDACFGPDGAFSACGPPDTWTCRADRREDGVCDCGCGQPDPDCEAGSCLFPGCRAPVCERCVDAEGRTAPCEAMPEFRCDEAALGDGQCDCGCGQHDPDCLTGSCTEPGCHDAACDVCHDAQGAEVPCEPPAASWHCDPDARGDGVCDCGCGIEDPDCADAGCVEPGCEADRCQVCHDPHGRELPCRPAWQCKPRYFGDGVCDCGCGTADPDCGQAGCTEAGCEQAECERRFDDEGAPLPPAAFTCAPALYGSGDGCHCGCNAPDPDCETGGCIGPDCRAASCDVCFDADGGTVNCKWACDDALYGADGTCDCGCGTRDPDCAGSACSAPGCFDDACGVCHDESGDAIACDRGNCPAGFKDNGVCDCGCRELDPECSAAASCVAPGCSARGCGVCHAADGSPTTCADWTCSFEQQGGGDGCNCGCGAADPDCAPAVGCAEPGCAVAACSTCRDHTGAPVECDP